VLDAHEVQAARLGELAPAVPHRLVADRAEQRDVLGRRLRDALVEAPHHRVDGVLGHDAIGRVLAARDGDEAWDRHGDGVLAAELGRLLGFAFQQRPQPGEDAPDVVVPEGRREDRVGALEDVVDVGPGRGGMELAQAPVRVRRAQQPVATPTE
jgi:hypothetical protein